MSSTAGKENSDSCLASTPGHSRERPDSAVPVGHRSCGACALCCKLLAITELGKPAGEWCPHSAGEQCCAIYERRPPTCRAWHCGYRLMPFLGEHWYPARCGMVVQWNVQERCLKIVVDDGLEECWTREPYAADISMLDRWCLASKQAFTIEEARGIWVFDPRGLSAAPLFVICEEDVVGLGPMALLKSHISLREACQLARAKYAAGYQLLARNGIMPRPDAAGRALAMRLAEGALYSVGLVADTESRVIHPAAAAPELAASVRDDLLRHEFSPADGLPLAARRRRADANHVDP